jgi:hypothetical protein
MPRNAILARYLPWVARREREREQRLAALRRRDGDDCRRCRRPLRFDLPEGHDRAPVIVGITDGAPGEPQAFDALCLTHRRCNGEADHTQEVQDRVRRKAEAALFAKPKRRKA